MKDIFTSSKEGNVPIKYWFRKRIFLPLVILLAALYVLAIALVADNTLDKNKRLQNNSKHLAQALGAAATQKNRYMIETLIQLFQDQVVGAKVLLCDKDRVVIASTTFSDNCVIKKSIFSLVLTEDIPGFSDYKIIVQTPAFSLPSLLFLFALPFAVGFIIYYISQRLYASITSEIFNPLLAGLNNSENLEITELNTLKKNIEDFNKLKIEKEKNESLSMLSRQVAHDIRSPLTALNTILKTSNLDEKDKVNLLSLAAKKINQIANDLLDKGRSNPPLDSESRGTMDQPQPPKLLCRVSEIREHIDETIKLKSVEYQEAGINFVVNYNSDSLSQSLCQCDGTTLARILSNLLNNSAEAISDSGKIIIDLSTENELVLIEVRDNGKGIKKDVLERIFEKGYSSGKIAGNGLGLYDAKLKIEGWGGKIAVYSTENIGSTVSIALPLINL